MAIRILLFRVPGVLRDVLAETFRVEPDIQLVDHSDAAPEITPESLARTEPDVVILGLEVGERPLISLELFGLLPGLKLVALEGQGREISIYELRPTRTMLGPLSPRDLVASIRRALEPMPVATRTLGGSGSDWAPTEDALLRVSLAREHTRP